MLHLGVFGGKYLTDCREASQLVREGKALPGTFRRQVNFFGVAASQPLSVWRSKGWIHREDPRGWFQWYCRYYRGRRLGDEDARQIKRWAAIKARPSTADELRAGRSFLPEASTPGAAALGL